MGRRALARGGRQGAPTSVAPTAPSSPPSGGAEPESPPPSRPPHLPRLDVQERKSKRCLGRVSFALPRLGAGGSHRALEHPGGAGAAPPLAWQERGPQVSVPLPGTWGWGAPPLCPVAGSSCPQEMRSFGLGGGEPLFFFPSLSKAFFFLSSPPAPFFSCKFHSNFESKQGRRRSPGARGGGS